ncbi:MAG TPA: hypothetical protein VK894_07345 [Jiangellales bacterium]|nr:hypothetical protein [Jiangellales bacterium]
MAGDPRSGLARLRAAADSGELDVISARHGVLLLSAFGSATRADSEPRDLDVAVAFDRPGGLLPLLEELVALTGTERLDLMDLRSADYRAF